MLEYTSLFADLEARFRSAGRDPASYRRLQKEVGRVADDLREYFEEVTTDYVVRLERRLAQPGARLAAEERALLRAYLGHPPEDPEREGLLVDDLARLEEAVGALRPLRDRPLNLKNLDALRRLLGRMDAVLPRIITSLEERERGRCFDEAVDAEGVVLDREWLLGEVRRALRGSGAASDIAAQTP